MCVFKISKSCQEIQDLRCEDSDGGKIEPKNER